MKELMNGLPRWQRRTLAVVIALCLALLTFSLVLEPAFALITDHRESSQRRLESVARYRAMARRQPEFVAALKQIEAHASWGRLYAGEAAAATALLQGEVRGLLDSQAVNVQVLQALEPITKDTLTRVGIRLGITADIGCLAAFLEGLQAAPHLIVPGEVSISSPQQQDPAGNPPLTVRLDLWSYLNPDTPAP